MQLLYGFAFGIGVFRDSGAASFGIGYEFSMVFPYTFGSPINYVPEAGLNHLSLAGRDSRCLGVKGFRRRARGLEEKLIFAVHRKHILGMKRILIITGSPRRSGNSELLARSFAKGALEAGHQVDIFEAGHKKIQGCRACNKCYSKGQACIFNDDFNEMAPLAEAADVLVLAAPLYWFGFPAQIKAAIDKLYALYVGKRDVKISETVLLTCGETAEMKDFEGIVRNYELIVDYLGWKDRGRMLVPKVNAVGDILRTDALREAEALGNTL